MLSQSSWTRHASEERQAEALAASCGIPRLLAQCLLNRGIRVSTEVRRFLHPTLHALSDPLALPGMAQAIAIIRRAITARDPILVFGDSDVDGITASTLVYETLTSLGGRVLVRLSNRLEHGYGFPRLFVRRAARAGIRLVILVDCGTNQVDEVEALTQLGIRTIILDHHIPTDQVAPASALVNPRLEQGPGRELCSAGLALKLAHALYRGDHERLKKYMDLAALGTLADYAPLVGDNRVFVTVGLEGILQTSRLGLRQLCESVEMTRPTSEQILRRLVPRLNAAGRLGNARPVWRLLAEESSETASRFADALGEAHAQTKRLHRQILMEAHEQVNRMHFKGQYVVVIGRQGWHAGLMGPVAAQMMERCGRPAISLALDRQVGVGSGRSPEGFNLFDALQACRTMLLRYGGHAQACGLTLNVTQVEQFRDAINHHASASLSQRPMMGKVLTIDAEVRLDDLTPDVATSLEALNPCGPGNPRPTFLVRGVRRTERDAGRVGLTDGRAWLAVKGKARDSMASGSYDVVVSPTLVDGDVVLSLRDLQEPTHVESGRGTETTGLFERVRSSSTTYTRESA